MGERCLGCGLVPGAETRRRIDRTLLSAAELECARLLSEGFTFQEIAEQRVTTVHGVSAALMRARVRRGAATNAHLIAILLRDGRLK